MRFVMLFLLVSGCHDLTGSQTPTAHCHGLLPGDLVFSEVMPNPMGDDHGQEWLEVFNATDREITLEGFTLVMGNDSGGSIGEVVLPYGEVAPGAFVTLGNVLEPYKPPHVDIAYGSEPGLLNNTAGRVQLRCGSRVLDAVDYHVSSEGKSRMLDGRLIPDGLANDKKDHWCDAVDFYDVEAFGTPGRWNGRCPGGPPPTHCLQPDGTTRPVRPVTQGAMVFTECMADPEQVEDQAGEWIEVHALAAVDLNGLSLGTATDAVVQALDDEACLAVTAGQTMLLAATTDTAHNGGLPTVDFPLRMSLPNADGVLWMGLDGRTIDRVSYREAQAGQSLALDAGRYHATENDVALNWCPGTQPYGDGDLGSPGQVNTRCPIEVGIGECLDENGYVRAAMPPQPGDVVISEFMARPGTSDTFGDWLEIYARESFDLNWLDLHNNDQLDSARATITAENCMTVDQDAYVLIGRNGDADRNGGLPPVDWVADFPVLNSGTLMLSYQGTLLDRIDYGLQIVGAASNLHPASLFPNANDDPYQWCTARQAYGDGDLGTPGSENHTCPVPLGTMPVTGEIVITELMYDPLPSSTCCEYIEVYNPSPGTTYDLLHCEIADADAAAAITANVVLAPGAHAVLARSWQPNVPFDFSWGNAFNLHYRNPESAVLHCNGIDVDRVDYEHGAGFPEPDKGTSIQLDSGANDADANDIGENWCVSLDALEPGYGSPRQANHTCAD